MVLTVSSIGATDDLLVRVSVSFFEVNCMLACICFLFGICSFENTFSLTHHHPVGIHHCIQHNTPAHGSKGSLQNSESSIANMRHVKTRQIHCYHFTQKSEFQPNTFSPFPAAFNLHSSLQTKAVISTSYHHLHHLLSFHPSFSLLPPSSQKSRIKIISLHPKDVG